MLAHGNQIQHGHEFEGSLAYTTRACLRTAQTKAARPGSTELEQTLGRQVETWKARSLRLPLAHTKSKARLSYGRPSLKSQNKPAFTGVLATSSHALCRWSKDDAGGHERETMIRAKLTLQARSTEPETRPASRQGLGLGMQG